MNVKAEYAEKQNELASLIRKTQKREADAIDLKQYQNSYIKQQATAITEKERHRLVKEYEQKANEARRKANVRICAVYVLLLGSLLYGFFITILTACKSERFSTDFKSFLTMIWKFISGTFSLALEGASATWSLNKIIPYAYVNVIVSGLLTVLVFVLIAVIIFGIVGIILYFAGKFFVEQFWDMPSLIVALGSMGLLVWFADNLSWVTWNMVLVWILIYLIYVVIRMCVTTAKTSY